MNKNILGVIACSLLTATAVAQIEVSSPSFNRNESATGVEIRLNSSLAVWDATSNYTLNSFNFNAGGAGGTYWLNVYQADSFAEASGVDFSSNDTTGLTFLGSSANSIDTSAFGNGDALNYTFSGITVFPDRDIFIAFSTNSAAGGFVRANLKSVNQSSPTYSNLLTADVQDINGAEGGETITFTGEFTGAGPNPGPAAPTGLAATGSNGLVSLDWSDNAESNLTYSVYRAITSGSYDSALTSGLTSSDYTDNSAVNNTTYYYVVTATDTNDVESGASGEVSATPADPNNQAPAFTSDPIIGTSALQDVVYSATIADDAQDPDSDPMTFSLISTSSWLSVASGGGLSGTPGSGDIGTNTFTVQVSAIGGSDTAELQITVGPPPPAQTNSVLWGVDGEAWDPDGQLRDFTTDCGYQGQGASLPNWPVWTNLTDLGATVDDSISDVDAFYDAISNCPPYHAIFLPNGTYIVDDFIILDAAYDNIVIRGESRDGTIIFFPKHSNEILKEAQSSKKFFEFRGGTNRGIENVSFIFRDETKATGYISPGTSSQSERHWFYSGEAPISFEGGEKNSWIQNVYIKNANHAITVRENGTRNITILDIVLDQFNGRTMGEDGTDGHMGIMVGNGADHCLVHNVLFTGYWAHDLAIMGTEESVFSRISGPDMELDHHANGNDYNLFTEIDKGKGDQLDGEASNNTLETYWGIKGVQNRGYMPKSGYDKQIGINTADPTSIGGDGTFESSWHHETIDPDVLEPANIWLAQMAYNSNPNIPADRTLTLPPLVAPYRLLASDDAGVQGASSSASNYGWGGTMAIKKGTIGGSTDRRGFMKFDLSGLGLTNVAHATLRFRASAASHSGFVLDINAVSDDSWSERTLTFDNMPASDVLVAQTSIPQESAWFDVDITSYVNSELTGDQKVSLEFRGSGNKDSATGISLKEGANAAELIIHTESSTVAAPATPSGLFGAPGDTICFLDWNDNVEDDFAGYNVYRSEGTNSNYKIWAMGLRTSDFFDHTVENGISYYYTVAAVDTAGTESILTSEVSITPSAVANNAPAFTSDPIVKDNAMSGWAYSVSIANDADDPEDDPMGFSLVSAQDWLSVATDGGLSGTPGPEDVGTNTFTVQVSAAGGSDTATLQIVVDANTNAPAELAGYDLWASTNGVGAAINDFDADGVSNFGEYALGGNPTNPAERGVSPAFSKSGNRFIYVHPQRSDDTSLSYWVETTTNLISGVWTNQGVVAIGTNMTGGNIDFVTNDVGTVEKEKFIRLKVEQ